MLLVLKSDNIWIHIGSMLLLGFIAVLIVKLDILHPYCWFSAFFCLYSIGYPILIAILVPSGIGYTKDSMILQIIALFSCLFVVGPQRQTKTIDDLNLNEEKFHSEFSIFGKILYYVLLIIICIAALYVSKMGFSGKDEIYQSGGLILNIIFRLPLVISIFFSILFISDFVTHRKISKRLLICTFLSLLSITLFSGERDFIFRFVLMTVFIFLFLNKISLKHLVIIIPILAILVPISSMFKYYFLGGEIGMESEYGILDSFISGEFESATRNLQLLINNQSTTQGCKGYELLFNDVLSIVNSNIESSPSWFNDTFYPNSITQYGFSLVGEGYIIDGVFGVITVFIILGIIIRFMYFKAFNNIYWFTAYIYFITVTIYSIRADLGTIYAALLKQIFLMILLVKLLELKRNKTRV